MIAPMRKVIPLCIIVTVYLLLGALYVWYTPAWQSPDEPAHYNYTRQLADGRLPVMEGGDYDETYRNEVISSGFAPQYDISIISYEDWQPPLYYLLQTPVYRLSDGSLLAMRLFSLFLGAGVVMLAYGVARLLFPGQTWVAWTTAVFVALLPQHLAILSSVNNDALAELLIAAILFLLVKWTQHGNPRLLLIIGGLLGLGFLTKGTVYLMAPVVGAALLWRSWRRRPDLLWQGLRVFAPALLAGGLWWGRNVAVYGWPDFLGKIRHDAVVVGQIRTEAWIAEYGAAGTALRFLQTTFHSFWGQFGWMALPMLHPPWLYPLLWVLVGTAVAGLFLAPIVWPKQPPPSHHLYRPLPFLLMGLLFLLTAGLHTGYNLTFVQHQGRYLFPALIPIALGMAVGLGAWTLLPARLLSLRFSWLPYALPLGLGLALAALDTYALFRIIVPNL